jgi:aspartyl-tRNA(Asn)/glutamyl-tRNA(Gln) amidotransferase subunit C
MPINIKQVEHLEELARLKLTAKERRLYAAQLSSILDYVNKLQEVKIEGVEPTRHATEAGNVWREDAAVDCPLEERKRILENAPERSDNFFKVKSVFNNSQCP